MFTMFPIGVVRCSRTDVTDDYWGDVECTIEISPELPAESLDGIEEFSHAEIFFVFDQVDASTAAVTHKRHPRNNPKWPEVGVFAMRAKRRPNRLGATIVRILGREGRTLRVAGLDAVDGTPVVDIKPVLAEFLPQGPVTQPAYTHELMRDYWKKGEGNQRDETKKP
jgi:tRNA-Thr(GGU) m(6)t(6)A37 methyltransferase TsaA